MSIEVFAPGEAPTPHKGTPWELLSPCPKCGSAAHDSPYGTDKFGDPHWVYEHCWKCGHRPGVNVAVSQDELARQFAAFQQFIADSTPQHHTLEAPDPNEVDALKNQMAEMQAELARYRQGADQGVPSHGPQTEG